MISLVLCLVVSLLSCGLSCQEGALSFKLRWVGDFKVGDFRLSLDTGIIANDIILLYIVPVFMLASSLVDTYIACQENHVLV